MDRDRVDAVAEAVIALDYEGIVAFDETEPEFDTIEALLDAFDDPLLVELLVVVATTADYQLNGDAQEFWRTLEAVVGDYGRLESIDDVRQILDAFMAEPVNARLEAQKRDRLDRLFGNDFGRWFQQQGASARPRDVWERLAAALETDPSKKTVVLAMKVFDIARLIRTGEYLAFPIDMPIPCDLQVERVSRTAGVADGDDQGQVMAAWGAVMEQVSDGLDQPVSVLRIDSIVWQAGQIIGDHEPDRWAARRALEAHFDEVGLDAGPAESLATELTAEL